MTYGPLCHNNEALHENTHDIFCHIYELNIPSILFTNMQISLIKFYVDFKKESMVH